MKGKFKSYTVIFLILIILGCSEKDDGANSGFFIQVTYNGKTYRENLANIAGTGYGGYSECDNLEHFAQYIGMIENSIFSFDAYLIHAQNTADYSDSKPGDYPVIDSCDNYSGTCFACSNTLEISFLLKASDLGEQIDGVVKIQSIKVISSNENSSVYAVSGTFSGTFEESYGSANTIEITGAFKTALETFN